MRALVRPSRSTEAGYAALLITLLLPVVFIGLAATAVDVARWYVEVQRVQKAADAGALGGVTYLPEDLTSATTTARDIAARNGFDHAASTVDVAVEQGSRPSQLRVTVSSTVQNAFGHMLGIPATTISRSAVADFTGPAPMGSPCNTFGNEPANGNASLPPLGSALPAGGFTNCQSNPQFWATIQGPETHKIQGDRYSTLRCPSSSVHKCPGGNNDEYAEEGYFFVVKVLPAAVGVPISVQLYDPAFVYTSNRCQSLPSQSNFRNNMNPYVRLDGRARYRNGLGTTNATTPSFCTGDYFPGGGNNEMTTSFVLREQTDTFDPLQAPVIPGCVRQYGALTSAPDDEDLDELDDDYSDHLARVFHNWDELCTFTPTRQGDYYLQVRTNVSLGGTGLPNGDETRLIYTGNPAASAVSGNTSSGHGNNAFGIRAYTPSNPALGTSVSVAGWERMPIFANATSATSVFNLIRALPGAAGQYVSFSFYDAGDATNAGTVRVMRPTDATGSITMTPNIVGCHASGPVNSTGLADCSVTIRNSTHNGKLQNISVPIPTDYDCNFSSQAGCWFRVEVNFPGGNVNDITTWDSTIVGDPVRLVE